MGDLALRIVCPSCSTSYPVPEGSIGATGRTVKCANCGEKWRVFPATLEEDSDAPASTANTSADASSFDDDPSTTDFSKTDDELWAAALGNDGEASASDTLEAAKDDEEADWEVVDWETAAADDQLPATVEAPLPKKAAQPFNPLTRLNSGADAVNRLKSDAAPIWEARRRNGWVSVSFCIFSILVIAAFFLLSKPLVRLAPDLASLYASVGIDVNLRGFEIQELRGERVVDNGDPVLLVTGVIVNVSNSVKETPDVRLGLSTNTNDEIYSWVYQPTVSTIVPGGIVKFRTRLVSPPAIGRNLSARFVNKSLQQTASSH